MVNKYLWKEGGREKGKEWKGKGDLEVPGTQLARIHQSQRWRVYDYQKYMLEYKMCLIEVLAVFQGSKGR